MRHLYFLLLVAGMAARAQDSLPTGNYPEWVRTHISPPQALMDSTVKYYIICMNYTSPNQPADKAYFDKMLDKYTYYRSKCLKYCHSEKERGDFFDYIVRQWHKAGKG